MEIQIGWKKSFLVNQCIILKVSLGDVYVRVFSVSDGGFSGYHQPSVCRFSRSSFVHSALLPPWRFKSIRMRFSLPDNCAQAPLILDNY